MADVAALNYSMADVLKAKGSNGFTLAGSFSGCGGSSIGYSLAGFDVRYACEFDEHAADCYRAAFPDTALDTRSITDVTGDSVLELAGLDAVDVWEGSPPCSKFSTAGKREKNWNKVTKADQAHSMANVEDLVFEWTRILGELKPRVAVAENVTGMLKGAARGQLIEAMNRAKGHGYRAKVIKLDASSYGVPQVRRRIFIICWDPDRCNEPVAPVRTGDTISAGEAFDEFDVEAIETSTTKIDVHEFPLRAPQVAASSSIYRRLKTLEIGQKHDQRFTLGRCHPDRPWATLGAVETASTSIAAPFHWAWPPRKLCRRELERIQSFPHDYPWPAGTMLSELGMRLGNSVPPFLAAAVGRSIASALDD